MDEARKMQQQQGGKKGKMDSACASFSLLHWTRSNIPRGSQLDRRPQSWPSNGERGPSDRHFIQPRGVGHRGGLITKTMLRNWSLQLSVMLEMFWNAGSVKKTDLRSVAERQTCQTQKVFSFFFFLNDTPVIYEYASAVIGKIARGSVLHDKLFVDILQYGVTSCTHMGLWQILHSYCSVALIFIISAIHYFCLAYVSVRLSICLGFSPSFPSTSLSLSLSLSVKRGLWML